MKAEDYFKEKIPNMRELWHLGDLQKKMVYILMEEYAALRIQDVGNRRELLCAFFKYFRDNGEANIGMTIEEFVDGFLITQRFGYEK